LWRKLNKVAKIAIFVAKIKLIILVAGDIPDSKHFARFAANRRLFANVTGWI